MADEYRALFGLNYKNEEGEEVRVEAGDKITDMPDNEASTQLNQKHIEEWEPRKTENVVDPEDADTEVQGVEARHANQGEEIVLKEAKK